MSSLVRGIQRQVMPSQAVHYHRDVDGSPLRDAKGRIKPPYANPPRKVFYMGRGDKLGVRNPKDAALLARLAREEKRRAMKGER